MKSLVQFINESKEKPMYDEWEIHSYVDYMLRAWFENNKIMHLLLPLQMFIAGKN